MRFLWLLLFAACSGSTTTDASVDSGTDSPDTGLDASDTGTDAPVDAGTDALAIDTGTDAGECPRNCIRDVIYWRWNGGLSATENSYEVSECARVLRTTTNLISGDSTICIEYVEQTQCSLVDPVVDLLSDPDVVAAREAAPILYGSDPRPMDGAVFVIDFGDALIEVGGDCSDPGCLEVPGGVAALQDALILLGTQTDESDACAAPLEDPATFDCRVGLGSAETTCLVGDEYCFEPFACRPTPTACDGPATCDCVGEGFPCEDDAGAVTVMWTE